MHGKVEATKVEHRVVLADKSGVPTPPVLAFLTAQKTSLANSYSSFARN